MAVRTHQCKLPALSMVQQPPQRKLYFALGILLGAGSFLSPDNCKAEGVRYIQLRAVMAATLGRQLKLTFRVFLLKILDSGEPLGKCLETSRRKAGPTFVLMVLLNGPYDVPPAWSIFWRHALLDVHQLTREPTRC